MQGSRQGIPLLQPCHDPCIRLAALRQGRRRPFPLPHGPAPPLLFLARRFLSTNIPGLPPQERQGPRQPLMGLSCPLLRYATAAPVFRAVMPPADRARAAPPGASRPVHFRQAARQPSSPSRHLLFSFVSESGCRRQSGMGHAPAARLAPCPRSRNQRGWWRRCSRRGRAEESLLTGFVHPRHVGRFTPAPVRPDGAPSLVEATPACRPASMVAVTRPPLRSGRDTSPFPPSPSRPLARTPGRRTASPSGRGRPVGHEIEEKHPAVRHGRKCMIGTG